MLQEALPWRRQWWKGLGLHLGNCSRESPWRGPQHPAMGEEGGQLPKANRGHGTCARARQRSRLYRGGMSPPARWPGEGPEDAVCGALPADCAPEALLGGGLTLRLACAILGALKYSSVKAARGL